MHHGNIATLDALRGLSAQAVLLGHYHALLTVAPVQEPASRLARLLWMAIDWLAVYPRQAVAVFFVLSGYLVGSRVLHDIRHGQFHHLDYLVRRFARLYSVIVPGLLLTWLAVHMAFDWGHGLDVVGHNRPWYPAWFDSAHSNSLSTLACNLAGLQMIACYQYGHNLALWSLSNELIYYVAFPSLVLMVAAGRPGVRLVHAAVVAIAALLMAAGNTAHDPERWLIYFNGFALWCAGAALPSVLRPWQRLPILASWLALGALLAGSLVLYRGASSVHVQDWAVAGLATCALAAGAFAPRAPALAARWAGVGASFSYSLYFIHLPLLLIVLSLVAWPHVKVDRDSQGAFLFLAACVAANGFAYLFYLAFERRYREINAWAQRLWRNLGRSGASGNS